MQCGAMRRRQNTFNFGGREGAGCKKIFLKLGVRDEHDEYCNIPC